MSEETSGVDGMKLREQSPSILAAMKECWDAKETWNALGADDSKRVIRSDFFTGDEPLEEDQGSLEAMEHSASMGGSISEPLVPNLETHVDAESQQDADDELPPSVPSTQPRTLPRPGAFAIQGPGFTHSDTSGETSADPSPRPIEEPPVVAAQVSAHLVLREEERTAELREQIRAEVEQELRQEYRMLHLSNIPQAHVLPSPANPALSTSENSSARTTNAPLSRFAHESLTRLSKLNLDMKPHGRDSELQTLMETYDRLIAIDPSSCQNEEPSVTQLILISGPSGCGKSFIARQLSEKTKCFFGKFDLQQRSSPYTAIINAYNDLCSHIQMSLNQEQLACLQADILRLLKVDIATTNDTTTTSRTDNEELMTTLVPALKAFLPENMQTQMSENNQLNNVHQHVDGELAKHRLNFLFCRLTKLLSTFLEHPLVIVLDDIMWADPPSLQLIRQLLSETHTENETSKLLLVGTYRDNEIYTTVSANNNNPFPSWLQKVQNELANDFLTEIDLQNLSLPFVQSMVGAVLSIHPNHNRACQLAKIIHQKTLGNPLFVLQFLQNLKDSDILEYNLNAMTWVWDQSQVEAVVVSDSVASILKTKLERLEPSCQFVAQVASCLGASFSFLLLLMGAQSMQQECQVLAITAESVSTSVESLLDVGLLERRTGNDGEVTIHFSHDQIQAAAFNQIPASKKGKWQAMIGEAILDKCTPLEAELWLFVIADLINHHGPQITCEQQAKILDINYRAGKKAAATSAHLAATAYLEKAISLLDPNFCWEMDLQLKTVDMHCTVAESAYCSANFETMQHHIDCILEKDVPFDRKIRPYVILINSLCARQCFDETIEVGLKVLGLMYGKQVFPSKTSTPQVVFELLKTQRATRKQSVDQLSLLPLVVDDMKAYEGKIIDLMTTAAYTARPEYFPLLPLKAVQLCLSHGVGPYSPSAFVTFAVILCGKLGALREGYNQGRVAMGILNRLPSPRVCQSRIYFLFFAFVDHWVNHASSNVHKFEEGYEIGMQLGDLQSAMYNKLSVCTFSWSCGKDLSLVEETCRKTNQVCLKHQQDAARFLLIPFWQQVLNLMGSSNDPLVLTGEAMDREATLQECKDINNVTSLIYGMELQLVYLLEGSSKQLEDLLVKAKGLPDHACGTVQHQRHPLFECLAALSLARRATSITSRYKWIRHGRSVKKQVKKWVNEGDVNSHHVLHLLKAELAALRGKHEKARVCYERAIALSQKSGYQQDTALSHELLGKHFLMLEQNAKAKAHLVKASDGYRAWGALAKVHQMQQRYKGLLEA